MRLGPILALVGLAALAISLTCGGSTETPQHCVSGQSIACVGPNACNGYQTCKHDESGFDPCQCGAGGATSSASASETSSASGTGGASTTSSSGATTSSSSSSTGAGGSGGMAPWTPASLAGLVVWLDDDNGALEDPQKPGTLLKWVDQSGHNNDATVGIGATYAFDPGALGAHQGIKCPHDNSLYINDSPSLHWGTGDFGIAMVVKGDQVKFWWRDNGFGNGVTVANNDDQNHDFRLQVGSTYASPGAVDPLLFHIVVARGQTVSLSVDGQVNTAPKMNSVNVDNPGASVVICSAPNGGASGEIAEVVAVQGTVTDAEVMQLEGYFKKKFGL